MKDGYRVIDNDDMWQQAYSRAMAELRIGIVLGHLPKMDPMYVHSLCVEYADFTIKRQRND